MKQQKTGILLVNLGSPKSTHTKDVRRYLDEFLMDGNVIDLPWLLRAFLVKGIILNTRPRESAEAYRAIWWDEGSPLIVISQRVTEQVKKLVDNPVALSMRYGEPSIEQGIRELYQLMPDMQEVYVVPLYPHYAMASTKTVVDKAQNIINKNRWKLNLSYLPHFFNEENYITSLAESIRPYVDKVDHILFSYHGIPERHLRKTDPTKSHCLNVANCCDVLSKAHNTCYRHQCFETTKLVVNYLKLRPDKMGVSFQSRLGSDPWLKPYTDFELERLAKAGVKHLAVVCPAFVSDCLETLEEIGIRGKEDFIKAGGEDLTLIPCLNENPNWIETLAGYCNNYVAQHTQIKTIA